MPLTINLRHLEKKDLRVTGELSVEELGLEGVDELIAVRDPLEYDLAIERVGKTMLVQGSLHLTLICSCARCLKAFEQDLELERFTLSLALEGDEQVEVSNDCVDLTPFIREDILLALPQHPLCDAECGGLPYQSHLQQSDPNRLAGGNSSAWSVLNKLKF